jgi:hypothetical protein
MGTCGAPAGAPAIGQQRQRSENKKAAPGAIAPKTEDRGRGRLNAALGPYLAKRLKFCITAPASVPGRVGAGARQRSQHSCAGTEGGARALCAEHERSSVTGGCRGAFVSC